MVRQFLRLAAASAWRDVGTAKIFQRYYQRLRNGAVRYGVRNGFLVQVKRRGTRHVTTMMDLPVRVVGRRIFSVTESSSGGDRSYAQVSDLEGHSLNREHLFDDSKLAPPENGGAVSDGASEVTVSSTFVFGDPPPDDAFRVNYLVSGSSPSPDVGTTYRTEVILLSNVDLPVSTEADLSDENYREFYYPVPAGVEPGDVFLWLQCNLLGSGGMTRRLEVSEQWVQQHAPGYRLAGFVYKERLLTPHVSGFSTAEGVFLQIVVRQTVEPFTLDTDNPHEDSGHAALLTAAFTFDDTGELTLSWTHLWEMRNESDLRLRSKVRPPQPEDAVWAETDGVSENDIVPKLYLGRDGDYLESLCIVITSATAYGTDREYDDTGGSIPEVSIVKLQWSSSGSFYRQVIYSNTVLSQESYTRNWEYENGTEISDLGDRQGVGGKSIVRPMPRELVRGSYGGEAVALVQYANIVVENEDGDSLTNPGLSTNSHFYYLYTISRWSYSVEKLDTGEGVSIWQEADIGVSAYTGDRVSSISVKRSSSYYSSILDGTACYGGDGLFFAVCLATDNNPDYAKDTPLLAVFDVEVGAYLKPLPEAGEFQSNEALAYAISCYQKRVYADSGAVETPAGLCVGVHGAIYLSSDEGDTWLKVADSGFFAPTLVFSTLWRPEPYNPKGSLGG